MSPADDADLLLRIVRRHLQAMRLNLSADYPDEEWGFQALQALQLFALAWRECFEAGVRVLVRVGQTLQAARSLANRQA